ncbi:MAG: alpha/beta fold hydrolase [Pseudomonadota bacterium]
MTKTLGFILLACLGAYAAAGLALFVAQRSFIYYPPATPMFPAPKTSTLEVPGAVLRISERPLKGERAVIYFGGNAEDVSASLPLLNVAFPDHALYLPHYRGYLGSTGTPSEKALVADALALFDRVAAEHKEIVVIGRSLGSGIAVQVAAVRPVKKLVLVTPFDSLQSLAARHFPYFPVRWLLRDRYESWRHAPQVKAPTLLLVAGQDEIIPAQSSARLLAHFPGGVATMQVIGGAGHNTISETAAYVPALQWAGAAP